MTSTMITPIQPVTPAPFFMKRRSQAGAIRRAEARSFTGVFPPVVPSTGVACCATNDILLMTVADPKVRPRYLRR